MREKLDLHTHFYTNWHEGKWSIERTPRTPVYILDGIRKARLDGIVLANAGSHGTMKDMYEQFAKLVKDRENLGRYSLKKQIANVLIFEDEKGLIKVIKGQEVHAEINGKRKHILAIGLNSGIIIPNLDLKSALIEIKKIGAISSAGHYNGFPGIGKENLIRYREFFDVFEGQNMNYTHLLLKPKLGMNPSIKEADNLAKEIERNWVSVSDCHNSEDVGNGYVETHEELDYSNADNLVGSLNQALINKKFTPIMRKKNSLFSVLSHAFLAEYDIQLRNRLGYTNLE